MNFNRARQNYLKALWIYLIALLLLGLTFHSEANVPGASGLGSRSHSNP